MGSTITRTRASAWQYVVLIYIVARWGYLAWLAN